MKKFMLFVLAIALVTFAGCTKSEVTRLPDSRAIGFDSFIGKATKAVTETTTDGLQAANPGFKVYGGYVGATTLFNGVNVSYNGGWSYSPLQYWVPGQYYKFAAYAPVDESLSPVFDYTSGNLTISNYSITNLAQSKDMVYATAERDNSSSEDTSPVSLTFDHIMSWVKIQFRHAMADGYKFTVSDVVVDGVKTDATFSGTGWTGPTEPASFTESGPLYVSGTDLPDAPGDVVGTDFIAVPQTIAAENLVITFKLQVQDATGAYLVGSATDGVLKTGKIESEQVWNKDFVYVYTAEINAGMAGVKPIEFTASVDNWSNTDDDGVIIIVGD